MKKCPLCGENKDLTHFGVRKKTNKPRSHCKKCESIESMERKRRDLLDPIKREIVKQVDKRYYEKNKEKIKKLANIRYHDKYKEDLKFIEKKKGSAKIYRQVNEQKIKENYNKNKDSYKIKKHEYYEKNKETIKQKARKYCKENRPIDNAKNARRRAAKRNATPKWLTNEHYKRIKEFFHEAKRLEKETGNKYHVDHQIPLISDTVCGLHVPWNLQILEASENISKGNRL